jgi:hypothetical protein
MALATLFSTFFVGDEGFGACGFGGCGRLWTSLLGLGPKCFFCFAETEGELELS